MHEIHIILKLFFLNQIDWKPVESIISVSISVNTPYNYVYIRLERQNTYPDTYNIVMRIISPHIILFHFSQFFPGYNNARRSYNQGLIECSGGSDVCWGILTDGRGCIHASYGWGEILI